MKTLRSSRQGQRELPLPENGDRMKPPEGRRFLQGCLAGGASRTGDSGESSRRTLLDLAQLS
jgi:hypothetical protein